MIKHTQTICRQFGDELFECLSPFCGRIGLILEAKFRFDLVSYFGLDKFCCDTFFRYKKLQKQLEFLEVQEEYIKDEQKNLKKEYLHAQEEVKRIQSVPLVIGQFLEAIDQNTGIVGSTTGMINHF